MGRPFSRSFDEAVLDADGPLGVMSHAGIVGDENDGDAVVPVELLEHLEDLLARVGIEVPCRLVREEHLGKVDERPGDCDALLLSAGELGRLMMGPVGQAHFFEHLHGPLPLLMLGEALPRVAQGHENVLQGSRAGEEIEALKDEADDPVAQAGPLLRAETGDLPAVEPVLAGGGVVEAPEDVHERALARAARAHERHQLAPAILSDTPLSTGRSTSPRW